MSWDGYNTLLAAQSPTHWYKMNETALPLVDSGSNPINMTTSEGAGFTYGNAGPAGLPNWNSVQYSTTFGRLMTTSVDRAQISNSASGTVIWWLQKKFVGAPGTQTAAGFVSQEQTLAGTNHSAAWSDETGVAKAGSISSLVLRSSGNFSRVAVPFPDDLLWHMVAITADGATARKIWVDGVEVVTGKTTAVSGSGTVNDWYSSLLVATGDFRLAMGSSRTVNAQFNGYATQLSVHDTVVPPGTILDLYNQGVMAAGGGGGNPKRRARQQLEEELARFAAKRREYRMKNGIFRPGDVR